MSESIYVKKPKNLGEPLFNENSLFDEFDTIYYYRQWYKIEIVNIGHVHIIRKNHIMGNWYREPKKWYTDTDDVWLFNFEQKTAVRITMNLEPQQKERLYDSGYYITAEIKFDMALLKWIRESKIFQNKSKLKCSGTVQV